MAVMSSSERLASKTQEIRRVLSEPTVDLWRLRELALSDGGLVNGRSHVIIIMHTIRASQKKGDSLAQQSCDQ